MESSTGRMLLVLFFATVTVTEAINYLALPRGGRSNYIAFPRLGRNYIAFPRMGRSMAGSGAGENGASCCTTGLKTEWLLSDDGTTSTQTVCEADACCPGLQEIMKQKPDGAFYTICIPVTSTDSKTKETDDNVLGKLQGLLHK